VPAGTPEMAVRLIGVEKPPVAVVPKLTSAVAGPLQAIVVGVVALNVNPDVAAVTVMLALLISKKILPIASTLILPVVVAIDGTVKFSVPSFAVLAERTVG
jgi:hypothetical protein